MLTDMTDLGSLLDMLATLVRWRLGWRYLYSSRFRAAVRAGRSQRRRALAWVETVSGLLFFAAANYVIGYVAIRLIMDLHGGRLSPQ
jgi:hypothetical protein